MTAIMILTAALWMPPLQSADAQSDSAAPRSTTERPNMSSPGMQQTISGALLDAGCSAIADSRSELTRTPRVVPRQGTTDAGMPVAGRKATERSRTRSATETDVPETYRDCRLKSSTTSFAIYSSGKVYMLDRVSNQMMQEFLTKDGAPKTEADSTKWPVTTVVGTATSDNVLTLRSVQK